MHEPLICHGRARSLCISILIINVATAVGDHDNQVHPLCCFIQLGMRLGIISS